MIVVKIKGGLGNQMFQYAMARKIQLEYQIDRIELDLGKIEQDTLRNYGLNNYYLEENTEILKNRGKWNRIQEDIAQRLVSYWVAGRPEGVARRREDILGSVFALFGVIQRDHSALEEKRVLKYHKEIYMNGWFQTASLLQPIRETLLVDFRWKDEKTLKQYDAYHDIISTNSVCLHVRKGDYVNNPIFDVCHAEYYYKAIAYMQAVVESPVFYLFSDDIEWVKENMKFSTCIRFMSSEHADYEDLYLMKSCRHFIMSNSTYSWWAQFLGTGVDKVVVAPDKWCLTEDMDVSVYMPEWVLISTT